MIAKSQDAVVALALSVLSREKRERMPYIHLASLLGMSGSEAFKATQRLVVSGLVEPSGWRPLSERLLNYLVYGVPHAFPGQLGGATRGVPTAWAAEPVQKYMPQGSDLPPIWASPDGIVRGYAVEPLLPSAPEAIKNLPLLYEPLALVDGLRVGRARDRAIASVRLKELLQHDTPISN